MSESNRPFVTLPRVVAVICCGIFAFVGSIVFFGNSVRGSWTPPPQTADARATLEESGVTTKAEPLFDIPRAGTAPIAVDGRLSHTQLERGQSEEFAAAIGVQAWSPDGGERPPIDVALVFDVSGSMEGEPLRNVQRAAIGLLGRLDARDRVTLVAYSSDAWLLAPTTHVTPGARPSLVRRIESLVAHGGTNISGGWEVGLEQLAEAREESVRRILILSDGQANEGVTDLDELGMMASAAMERGISTTTMGVGLDYNEDLMQRMARSGGGNYYFVAGSAPDAAFDDELASLTGRVSSRTRLRVVTNGGWLPTVEGYDWRPIHNGIEIELGALSQGMRRDVLLEFGSLHSAEPFDVSAELIWVSDRTGEERRASWSRRVNAGDSSEYDRDVLSRLQKVKTARALHDATVRYQSGDRVGAARLLESTISLNETFVDDYDVDEDVFERANDTLADLADDIRNYDPNSNRGKYMIKGSKFKSANVAVDSSVTF